MPVVPTYKPQVKSQPFPTTRQSAVPDAEYFGGGASAEKVTRATQGLIGVAGDIIATEQQRANETASLEADTKLAASETSLQTELSKLSGKDAMKAPDVAKEQWAKSTAEIQKGLSNRAQKDAFDKSAATRWASLNKNVTVHVSSELEKLADITTKSALETARNAAALNWGDDQRIGLELTRQKDAVTTLFQRKGIPLKGEDGKMSDAYKATLTKELSATHKDVLGAMIAAGQDQRAKAYFEAAKGREELTSDDVALLGKAVKHSSVLEESQRLAQAITQKHSNEASALKSIDQITSPEVKKATTDLVKERFQMMEAGKERYKKASYESLAQQLEKTGDLLTIQRDKKYIALDDNQQAALLNRYDRKLKGVDRKTDEPAFLEFISLTPAQLAAMNVSDFDTQFRQKFSNSDQDKAETAYRTAKQGDEKNQLITPFASYKDRFDETVRLRDIVDPSSPKKSDEDTKLYFGLTREVRKRIEQVEVQAKRRATGEEIQKEIDAVIIDRSRKAKIQGTGRIWNTEKAIAVMTDDEKRGAYVPLKAVPQSSRVSLEKRMKDAGKTVTSDKLERAYAAVLAGDAARAEAIISE